ncbi:unnamed protein product [Nyctereutes procyonoides]|uniref:(raccoon dog) hypothetical protein n=1 Tax=Nyctereutes procyonoides TaxID=34880 RepID=A0A811ZPP9_NYCPR|nr:unnamed protein product [Nyctereutes procyonoides]
MGQSPVGSPQAAAGASRVVNLSIETDDPPLTNHQKFNSSLMLCHEAYIIHLTSFHHVGISGYNRKESPSWPISLLSWEVSAGWAWEFGFLQGSLLTPPHRNGERCLLMARSVLWGI